MRTSTKNVLRRAVCGLVSASMLLQPLVSSAAQLNLAKAPLFVAPPVPPLVMLDISKDQQLYKKAYNDYSDLDNDGTVETTYKHSIDYYGYFDPYKCYTYGTSSLSGSNHFIPSNWTSDKYCDGTKWSGNFLNWVSMSRMDAVRKLLFGGARSTDPATPVSSYGSMSILERSYLPTDAHSWAKYYNGNDINRLTPFNPPTTPTASATFTDVYGCGSVNTSGPIARGTWIYICSLPDSFYASLQLGDQVKFSTPDGTKNILGRVVDFDRAGGFNYIGIVFDGVAGVDAAGNSLLGNAATNINTWKATNMTNVGISFCNTTLSGGKQYSQDNTAAPLMRVVRGNYEWWSAGERWQCYLREERSSQLAWAASNGNQMQISGSAGSAENPSKDGYNWGSVTTDARGLGVTDYNVRVEACHNAFYPPPTGQKTSEKCKQYDQAGYYRPIGLLQVYGENGQILYGLMTGSYNKNTSGGLLRKNVSDLSTEITSTGKFVDDPSGGNIIRNLSRMRIFGYDYNDGTYIGADNCSYQITSTELTDGRCRSWGNPMSEIYMESIRYFAGATGPTAAYDTDDSSLFAKKLTQATWPNTSTKVLSNSNYCAPLNVLVFNASVSSKDSDLTANPFVGVTGTPQAMTDTVGTSEGIPGKSFFIGSNGATSNNLCDAKSFTGSNLGSAQGLCPEAPSLNGSFLMAGLAYTAKTNRIRNDLTVPATDSRSLKVSTYGISLATNVPRIDAYSPSGKKVVIQPTFRLDLETKFGAGSIVDVKLTPFIGTCPSGYKCGAMSVVWEDSEQGGDYDQDVVGTISYQISDSQIKVTTQVVSASTANPQGFGYVISGTNKDGPHFHSGIISFTYPDPMNIPIEAPAGTSANGRTLTTNGGAINESGGCGPCNPDPNRPNRYGAVVLADPPTTATYTLSSTPAANSFQDPLWYAAKYGGFSDSNGNALPDLQTEWDKTINATGALGSDGIPDNFFQVTNPLGLELALDRLFISILQSAAASAVATNSSKLNAGTRVYQAVFNPSDWSGKMMAFTVDATTGAPASTPDWDGGQVDLNAFGVNPASRKIITTNKYGNDRDASNNLVAPARAPQGIAFRYPTADPSGLGATSSGNLSLLQITALRTNPDSLIQDAVPGPWSASTDPGSLRLNYLRGDGVNEGLASTNYRRRATSKLGDIVNSNPVFVGRASGGYPDNFEATPYSTFAATTLARKPVLYVGANDGMLHAFNACPPSSESGRPANCSSGTPGSELLAFVPSPVYRNLSKLTSRAYQHEYYVDGSPAVEDAYVGSAWKTVLVSGLGRGGQGVFALDVTNPESFSEANASSIVMWEFTDADDPDFGYSYGTPLIRKMANGKWAAIVSGGYNNSQDTGNDPAEKLCTGGSGTSAAPYTPTGCTTSLSGRGFIFIIFLEGPTGTNGAWRQGVDYVKVQTFDGTLPGHGSISTPNGLAQPLAADVDGDGKVDQLYAGDLLGNVWRFDTTSTSPTTWASSSSAFRLFTTSTPVGSPVTQAQPITAPMDGVIHPSGQGVMLTFGTGKYLETTDTIPNGSGNYPTQTIYGLWDKGGTIVDRGSSTVISGRSELMAQKTLQLVTFTDGSIGRITTRYTPNYNTTGVTASSCSDTDPMADAPSDYCAPVEVPPQRGWLLDMFNKTPTAASPLGERMIYAPQVVSGIGVYASLWPQSNTCIGSTAGDNITLNAVTGQRPDAPILDTTADKLVNSSDMVTVTSTIGGGNVNIAASSQRVSGGSAQTPTFIQKGSLSIGYQNPTGGGSGSGASGSSGPTTVYAQFPQTAGRVSWREILY